MRRIRTEWDQDGIRRYESVECQQVKGGRTIQDDEIVVIPNPVQFELQPALTVRKINEL